MATSRPAREFESLRSAAERTGFSICAWRSKVAAGELPAFRLSDKPGAAIRVRVADVDALMKPLIPDEVYPERINRTRDRTAGSQLTGPAQAGSERLCRQPKSGIMPQLLTETGAVLPQQNGHGEVTYPKDKTYTGDAPPAARQHRRRGGEGVP